MKRLKNNIDIVLLISGLVLMTPLLFDNYVIYKWIIMLGVGFVCVGFAIGLTGLRCEE